MARKKSVTQQLAEREIERKERIKEIEVEYASMVDRWKESGWEKYFSLPEKKEWTSRKLKEWENQQPLIISGKYQDREKIVSNYQQKFVEYVKQLCPQVIEELREFTPYFNNLFGEQKEKYIDIFNRHKNEFFELNNSLDTEINNSTEDWQLRFRPEKYRNWRFDFNFGEYQILFQILYLLFVSEESTEKRNKILDDAIQRIQNDFVYNHSSLTEPDNFNEELIQQYIFKQSINAIKEILFNDVRDFFRKEAKRKVIKFLENISPNPETNFVDFISLQIKLLKWSERYNLNKDWLFRYAYHFLFQFSNNPNIKIEAIEIPFLNIRSLEGYPFEFKFHGWFAGDVEKEEYEKQITESFEAELQKYFHNVSNFLKLNELKRVTRPPKYDRVKWLVRWTVQNWSKEQIRDEIEQNLHDKGKEKYIDISTIDKAFRDFKQLHLPIKD